VSSPLSQATARIHDSEPGFGSLAFPERTAGPLLFCKNLKPWRFHTLVRGRISKLVCFRSKPVARHSSPSPLRQRPRSLSSRFTRPRISPLCRHSGQREAPLMGFSKDRLSTSISAARPHLVFTRVTGSCPPAARRCHPSRALRSCRSTRLQRFPPCDPLQVYCALQPVLRFALFQIAGVIAAAHCCSARVKPAFLLKGAVHTLQSLPLAVRRTASPRPLPSCRYFRPTSRLFSCDESVVLHWRCRQPRPDALLGFVPLQGSPRSISPFYSQVQWDRTGPARTPG